MSFLLQRACFERLALISSVLVFAVVCGVACSGSGSQASRGDGGPDSGGGSTVIPGTGGTGGAAVSGSGGTAGSVAGSGGSGGQAGQGGSTASGGTSSAGGTATGGKSTTGGTTSGGGGTGGNQSGGTTGTAGTTGFGGKGGTGGTTSPTTGAGGSGAAGSTGSGAGDFGFTFRPVQSDKQLDFLCTLSVVGASTYVYVQLDQTGTKSVGIATIPVYATGMATMSANGTVTDLTNATYDYGGGHHSDSIQFEYQGKSYKYYHSSFGFGFRPCQPMDCVSIYPPGGTTPSTDGCTAARALPEVCVPIKADGTHEPLTDTFKKCPGDSNK